MARLACLIRLRTAALAAMLGSMGVIGAVAAAPSQLTIEATNPLDIARPSETIELDYRALADAMPALRHNAHRVRLMAARVYDALTSQELVTQTIDADGDTTVDTLLFQHDFAPGETRQFVLVPSARVPIRPILSPVHVRFAPTRIDDVAWESDRIAYRTYGPTALRNHPGLTNGIDVWGKRVSYPVIESWYTGGRNWYEVDRGEGADHFLVGATLGCGASGVIADGKVKTFPGWRQHKVLSDGPIRTLFNLDFGGADAGGTTVTQHVQLSLDAGHNLTRFIVTFDSTNPQAPIEWAGGIVRREGQELAIDPAGAWISQWGPLDEAGHGDLGMAVVMAPGEGRKAMELDGHALVTATARAGEPSTYWSGAGWNRSGQFRNAADWNEYIAEWARRVAEPVEVSVRPGS